SLEKEDGKRQLQHLVFPLKILMHRLRKHYVSLIHHYEQIYHFEAKGCSTSSQ
ncbi:hypothetical protein MKX03_007139, partial [Papaver bracteatum]